MQASSFPSPSNETNGLMRDISRVLFTQEEIQQRIGELGGQISSDYAGLNPLFVGVLKGVVFFMSDLMRAITIPARMDFMAISRYAPQAATVRPKDRFA